MTYSASGEDDAILKFFGDFKGRFLDIGAADGKVGSNTLAFAERGWSGVVVEASPHWMRKLIDTYRQYPKVRVVHGAMAPEVASRLSPMWDTKDYTLTTLSKPLQDRGCGREEEAYELIVPTFSFDDLENYFGSTFEYVSIDVEGMTIPILKDLPLNTMKTDAICVEYFTKEVLGADEIAEIKDILCPQGFSEIKRTSENIVMVRK